MNLAQIQHITYELLGKKQTKLDRNSKAFDLTL